MDLLARQIDVALKGHGFSRAIRYPCQAPHLTAVGLSAGEAGSERHSLITASAFSMSRSLVSRFVLCFSFIGFLLLLLFELATHVALHRVSIRTLGELTCLKLGAGWGSRGESMLPFIGRPLGQNALAVIGTRCRRNK